MLGLSLAMATAVASPAVATPPRMSQRHPHPADQVRLVAGDIGLISGRFTKAKSVGIAKTRVTVTDINGAEHDTRTDAKGRFTFKKLPVGLYRIGFFVDSVGYTQYAPGRGSMETAQSYRVTKNHTTVVNEVQRAAGRVEVHAVDAAGKPLDEVCIRGDLFGYTACGIGSPGVPGSADLPAGTQSILVFDHDPRHGVVSRRITVAWGKVTKVKTRLGPGGGIAFSVIDRQTKKPVAADVTAVPVTHAMGMAPDESIYAEATNHAKDVIGGLRPGKYRLFVSPIERDAKHGAQWMGRTGGTGGEASAMVITVAAGKVVNAPVIKLDGAGSVAATAGDDRLGYVTMSPLWEKGPDTSGEGGVLTLDRLGPYSWDLLLRGPAYGQTHVRKVAVKVGQTTDATFSFATPSLIRGSISLAKHGAIYYSVYAVDAVTGEIIGETSDNGDQADRVSSYELAVEPGHRVKLIYAINGDWQAYRSGWFGGASFGGAKTVDTNANQIVNLNY